MTYILNIETATRNCSVSISQNGKTLVCQEIAETGYTHAEKLHVFIEEVLQKANLKFSDLHAVAVSQGPGSYTGLRIGVSSAKGLCYALQIPLIAVDTLAVLAESLSVENGVIIPMIDARRMECYTAIFDTDKNKIREVQSEIITEDSFKDIQGTIHFLGDGTAKCQEVLNNSRFVYHLENQFPSATNMSALAFAKYEKSDFVDVAYFEPFYLKEFMLNVK